MKLVDIHTHHQFQLSREDSENIIMLRDQVDTIGMHPWHLSADFDLNQWKQNNLLDSYFHLNLIGEIGLDRVFNKNNKQRTDERPIHKQIEFLEMICSHQWAQDKKFIFHIVRAHSDLFELMKKYKWRWTFLLHDFRGNASEAKYYLKHDAYFSFGDNILKSSKTQQVVESIPIERIFIESDDRSFPSSKEYVEYLQKNYRQLALLKKLSEEEVIIKLYLNYRRFMGNA